MSAKYGLSGIIIAAGVALFAGGTLVNAQVQSEHMRYKAGHGTIIPTMPGQDAFGAVQEIVRLLEGDPATDWSKVNLAGLREHLIDMNEVTLRAAATERKLDYGIQIDVTGKGRTLDAIKRMIPAHARELNGLSDWRAVTEVLDDGVRMSVTSTDPAETRRIRGLGFIGLMVIGSHHQQHHLMMARGEHIH